MDNTTLQWEIIRLEHKKEQHKKIIQLIDEQINKLFQRMVDQEFLAKSATNYR